MEQHGGCQFWPKSEKPIERFEVSRRVGLFVCTWIATEIMAFDFKGTLECELLLSFAGRGVVQVEQRTDERCSY